MPLSTPSATPRRGAKARAVPEEAARTSLTPDSWIDAATEVLVNEGIDHVRVDVLAKTLGVTRGSFYWHFKDRQDLLGHVLQAWRDRATEQVTLRFTNRESDPRALLRELVSLPHRGRAALRAARIELAIRAWARRDEMARHAVDEADAARIAYQAQVFTLLGFSLSEARQRAFMLYSYNVAESLLYRQGTPAQRTERAQFVERLVLQPLNPR